jgi:hypothetical protein
VRQVWRICWQSEAKRIDVGGRCWGGMAEEVEVGGGEGQLRRWEWMRMIEEDD